LERLVAQIFSWSMIKQVLTANARSSSETVRKSVSLGFAQGEKRGPSIRK